MMIATNVYPAESPVVESTMSWPGFVMLGLITLSMTLFAVIAPFVRRRRHMIVTDVLHE